MCTLVGRVRNEALKCSSSFWEFDLLWCYESTLFFNSNLLKLEWNILIWAAEFVICMSYKPQKEVYQRWNQFLSKFNLLIKWWETNIHPFCLVFYFFVDTWVTFWKMKCLHLDSESPKWVFAGWNITSRSCVRCVIYIFIFSWTTDSAIKWKFDRWWQFKWFYSSVVVVVCIHWSTGFFIYSCCHWII